VSSIFRSEEFICSLFKKILDGCNTFVFHIILKFSMLLFILAKTKMHHKDEFS